MQEPEWLTPEQVSSRLNVGTRHLANLRSRKDGPGYVRIGKQILYNREALDKYIRTHTLRGGKW